MEYCQFFTDWDIVMQILHLKIPKSTFTFHTQISIKHFAEQFDKIWALQGVLEPGRALLRTGLRRSKRHPQPVSAPSKLRFCSAL